MSDASSETLVPLQHEAREKRTIRALPGNATEGSSPVHGRDMSCGVRGSTGCCREAELWLFDRVMDIGLALSRACGHFRCMAITVRRCFWNTSGLIAVAGCGPGYNDRLGPRVECRTGKAAGRCIPRGGQQSGKTTRPNSFLSRSARFRRCCADGAFQESVPGKH